MQKQKPQDENNLESDLDEEVDENANQLSYTVFNCTKTQNNESKEQVRDILKSPGPDKVVRFDGAQQEPLLHLLFDNEQQTVSQVQITGFNIKSYELTLGLFDNQGMVIMEVHKEQRDV